MCAGNIKIEDRILLKEAIEKSCNISLGRIYRKYESVLAKYIGRKVRFDDDSQDLTQAVFLRLCQGNCKYSGQSDVRGYLCGIAKNVIRDHFKAKNRVVEAVSLDGMDTGGELLIAQSHTEEPLEGLQKEEIRCILRKEILTLPAKSHNAVELVYMQKIDVSTAAAMLNCSEEVLRKRLDYAVLLLREKFYKL